MPEFKFGSLGSSPRVPPHAPPSAAATLPSLRLPVLPTLPSPCRTAHQPSSSKKDTRLATSNKGKEIAIHNSFQELARSGVDGPEAPSVDPSPRVPSQSQPPPPLTITWD
ncbi:hypothetical protein Salat_2691300 [Sesamum alatum]|uniref:Uncharacterized protein n=1 Tax=Sesamum alatum TaxID=300844 RepID=A0AAE1XPT5_9LAMI|nr:hypothetical protein Salat_2691300 [Sesamum alatum]